MCRRKGGGEGGMRENERHAMGGEEEEEARSSIKRANGLSSARAAPAYLPLGKKVMSPPPFSTTLITSSHAFIISACFLKPHLV